MAKKKETVSCYTSIGGQALMEGIMMRGPQKTSVSVRLPDGTIDTQYMDTHYLRDRYKILQKPLLRGVAGLIDSLRIGYKALMYSAEKSGLEDEEEPSKFDQWIERVFGDKIMNVIMVVAAVLGVALAVLLFFMLPTWVFNLLTRWLPALGGHMIYRSIIEGVMRIGIFLIYIVLCSRMKEIHRVFAYHGAEHKTIFCYESNEELTVENVRKHIRFHPRCGTSFLLIMLLLGIILGFFIPFQGAILRSVTKILCLPIVIAVGFELIRLCGRYNNAVTRAIAAPGLWMQRITTKEPDDGMIEVAIEALKAVIPENGEDRIQS
jgi:uncharacterized protein YqhQ